MLVHDFVRVTGPADAKMGQGGVARIGAVDVIDAELVEGAVEDPSDP